MSQSWTNNTYEVWNSAGGQALMQAMKDNFQCLKTSFSGSTPPDESIREPFMLWGDDVNNVLRFREMDSEESSSTSDEAWPGLYHSDGSNQNIWVYRNDTPDGYALNSTSDCLLSVKGGSNDYATYGMKGTWDMPDIPAHTHQWYDSKSASESDATWDSEGTPQDWPELWGGTLYDTLYGSDYFSWKRSLGVDCYTSSDNKTVDNSWRPQAAVGVNLYLDV